MWALILVVQISLNIKNADFENWVDTTTPVDWVVSHPAALPVYKEKSLVRTGGHSVKVERASKTTNYTEALVQFVPIADLGLNHKIIFYIYDNDPDVRGRVHCTWCKSDSTSLSDYFFSSYSSDLASWQELLAEEVPPTGARFIKLTLRIYLQTGSTDSLGYVFFDSGFGLKVEEREKTQFLNFEKNNKEAFFDITGRKNRQGKIVFKRGVRSQKILKIR
ncbi:MAG: hypothetical protein ABDH49_00070 [Candidatus Hydrothermales bacterium]